MGLVTSLSLIERLKLKKLLREIRGSSIKYYKVE